MTKERRLAIRMWEQIVEVLENKTPDKCYLPIINSIKEDFCRAHNLEWKYGCWFCQYVRLNWRPDLYSREGIPKYRNGCQRCPLYKERADILNDEECGCTVDKETLWKQVTDDYNVYAARRILELLKGGHNERSRAIPEGDRMNFKSCINKLLQNYFYGNGQLKMIDSENSMVIFMACRSCADSTETLYLICNVLENMKSKYSYDLCVVNYNPYFNPLENDKDCFMNQLDKFFERNYLFDDTEWSVYEEKL